MVDVEGAAAREQPPEHDAKPGRLCLQPTGDRGFESCSLHRGVICEPDFLDQGADRRNLVSASNGGPDDGISSEDSRGAIQPIISFGTAPPSRARGPPERQSFSVEAR